MHAHEAFRKEYGTEPAGLWAAPGRVNLIGEHTDYNDGFVLPFALPQHTVAAVGPAESGWTVCSDFAEGQVVFDDLSEPGLVDGWAAYVAGVVWVLADAGHPVPPARIAIASDVPAGAGVSSSAAVESAVLTALIDLGGLDIPVADRPATASTAPAARPARRRRPCSAWPRCGTCRPTAWRRPWTGSTTT